MSTMLEFNALLFDWNEARQRGDRDRTDEISVDLEQAAVNLPQDQQDLAEAVIDLHAGV